MGMVEVYHRPTAKPGTGRPPLWTPRRICLTSGFPAPKLSVQGPRFQPQAGDGVHQLYQRPLAGTVPPSPGGLQPGRATACD